MRAMFLLLVFSLNTIAGFACSLGVDMGYNRTHHSHEKHSHNKPHTHKGGHQHRHSHTPSNVSGAKVKGASDDCCTNSVVNFTQLDKSVAYNNLLLIVPFVFININQVLLLALKDEVGPAVNSRFQFVRRSCFLNDTDIQTGICRYQI